MLSEHFSENEFRCKCCGTLPPGGISRYLIAGLEELRGRVGVIHITNGYRCKEHNVEVGGVKLSFHTQGCAADIWTDDYPAEELAAICETIFDGVGTYAEADFVHVDMRDDSESPGVYIWEG